MISINTISPLILTRRTDVLWDRLMMTPRMGRDLSGITLMTQMWRTRFSTVKKKILFKFSAPHWREKDHNRIVVLLLRLPIIICSGSADTILDQLTSTSKVLWRKRRLNLMFLPRRQAFRINDFQTSEMAVPLLIITRDLNQRLQGKRRRKMFIMQGGSLRLRSCLVMTPKGIIPLPWAARRTTRRLVRGECLRLAVALVQITLSVSRWPVGSTPKAGRVRHPKEAGKVAERPIHLPKNKKSYLSIQSWITQQPSSGEWCVMLRGENKGTLSSRKWNILAATNTPLREINATT